MAPWNVSININSIKNEEKLEPSVVDCHPDSITVKPSGKVASMMEKRWVKKESRQCLYIKYIVCGTQLLRLLKGSGNHDGNRYCLQVASICTSMPPLVLT